MECAGLHRLFLPAEQGFRLGLPDTIKMKMQRWPDCQQDTVIMMDTGVKDTGGAS
jgi:hypothetical protein